MPARLRTWLRLDRHRRDADGDLSEEVRVCVDILTDDYVSQGIAPDEARRRALIAIEGVEQLKERVRYVRGAGVVNSVLRDVPYALRLLRKRKMFAATAIASLAIAIGAASAVYSWAGAMFLRDPTGVADPSTLVAIFLEDDDPGTEPNILPVPHFQEIERASAGVFDGMAGAFRFWAALGGNGTARPGTVEYVTGRFFGVTRAHVALGRGIEPRDDQPGAAPVAVISDRTWRVVFSGSLHVLGQTLRLNGKPFTIVGVAAADFAGLDYSFYGPPDAWTSTALYAVVVGPTSRLTGRGATFRTVARLAPGVTREAAEGALVATGKALSYQPNDFRKYTSIEVLSIRDARIPGYTRRQLGESATVLLIVTVLLVAAACVNVSNFLLSQGLARQEEMALRTAVGATRAQIFRQILTECAVLGTFGGVGGVGLALLFAHLLEAFPQASNLGTLLETPAPVDLRLLAFGAVGTGVAIMMFGLLPAVLVSGRASLAVCRDAGQRFSRGGVRARQIVLGLQAALSVVLAIVAGLYARSLFEIERLHYPYENDALLLARVNPVALPAEGRQRFYLEILRQVRGLGDVAAAGYSYNPLLSIGGMGVLSEPNAAKIQSDYTTVGPGFFDAIGVPLREGREFRDEDAGRKVTIMNATLANRLWPGEEAVGRTVYLSSLSPTEPFTVVGVVEQPKCNDRQLDPLPCVYTPSDYGRSTAQTLHVRSRGRADLLALPVRSIVQRVEPEAVVESTLTLRQQISRIRMGPRVTSGLTAAMAVMASLLAVVGCSALLMALIGETRRELAIRLALGSGSRPLTRHVMMRALIPYGIGIAFGILGAWALASRLTDRLYETSVRDPVAYMLPVAVLVFAGIVASYWPTRNAVRTNPAILLRS